MFSTHFENFPPFSSNLKLSSVLKILKFAVWERVKCSQRLYVAPFTVSLNNEMFAILFTYLDIYLCTLSSQFQNGISDCKAAAQQKLSVSSD